MELDIIDVVLAKIDEKKIFYHAWGEIKYKDRELEPHEIFYVVDVLRNRRLIKEISKGKIFILNERGKIALNEGYAKFIDSEEEIKRLNIELAQSNLDANIEQSEHRKFLKRWTIINAVISLINILGLTGLIMISKKIGLL